MRLRRLLVTTAIGLHFLFVLSVVSHVHDWMLRSSTWRPVAFFTEYYSSLTFANRNFGFFAPAVTADWNLRLLMTSDMGEQRPYEFHLPNREMKVKSYSMLGHFAESNTSMDLFARSWALKAMNENPDVVRVDVVVTQNYIPAMEEFRRGGRIVPQPYYRTRFDAR